MSNVKTANAAKYLIELMQQNGTACASMSDGVIILISKEVLSSLVSQAEDIGYATIFVKNGKASEMN